MSHEDNELLRYPIGREPSPIALTADARASLVADIAALPSHLRDAVGGLAAHQLDTPYRDGGWTVRQVVHHVADSHMNAYVRLKLALTADAPRIAPYDQAAWAALADSRLPVDVSLALVDPLHARWVALYAALDEHACRTRRYYHPELAAPVTIDEQLQTYAWHSRHHVAHIQRLRARQGW